MTRLLSYLIIASLNLTTITQAEEQPTVGIPIYSQKLFFPMPKDMKPAHQSPAGPIFAMEFVPKDESIKSWTQLFMVAGFKDLALRMELTKTVEVESEGVKKACPEDFIKLPVDYTHPQGIETISLIMGCKKSPAIPEGLSESAAYIFIKGKREIYYLKKAFRYKPGKIDLNPATAKTLVPEIFNIKLCKNDGQTPICEEEKS